MSDIIGTVLDAYREAVHITEWTGLSLGLLAALALLVYLDPAWRATPF